VATVTIAFPGTVLTETEDRMALKVLDTIISGYRLPSGWLHTELRGNQLVYVVHAYEFTGLAPGYFVAFAACEPDKVNDVIEALERNLAKTATGEFTEEELVRAKGIIIAAEVIDRQTNADLASTAALDELYGLGYDHWQALAERINAVTMAEVKRVGVKYLSRPHLICVTTPKPEVVKYPPAK
jgi:zinc protease